MKLQRVATVMSERLDRKGIALGQQLAAGWQVEAFAVPLIYVVGPFRTDLPPGFGRANRVITNFGMALRMWKDARAEVARHHLRTEADAEIWLLVAQRHADPVDLPSQEVFIIVGALWTAENCRPGMVVHCVRQRIAESRPADIERIPELRQRLAYAARRGVLLVQNEKDGLQHDDSACARTGLTTNGPSGVFKYGREEGAMCCLRALPASARNARLQAA